VKIRVCDEDRELFGCDEWLEFTPLNISLDALDELAQRFDFDPGEWPEPFYGQLTLEQAGVEGAKPKSPPWRARATVWMLLRQNGFPVSWEDVGKSHPYLARTDASLGKAEDPSPPSEPSTTPRSRTSSRATRKKSSTE
jgi:hypothetical protein